MLLLFLFLVHPIHSFSKLSIKYLVYSVLKFLFLFCNFSVSGFVISTDAGWREREEVFSKRMIMMMVMMMVVVMMMMVMMMICIWVRWFTCVCVSECLSDSERERERALGYVHLWKTRVNEDCCHRCNSQLLLPMATTDTHQTVITAATSNK